MIDVATLSRVLDDAVAEVADEAVDGKSHSGSGLRRVRCRMADGSKRSVVRKECRPHPIHARDPGYARREADCYAHRLFDGLERLRTPRAYGWEERPDGVWWLWLEDLGDAFAVDWTPALLDTAVRDLAELHARWWGRVDDLAAMGYLRRRAQAAFDGIWVERITQNCAAIEAHPRRDEIAAVFSPRRRRLLERLSRAADLAYPPMDALTQTLLHQDVWLPNLGRDNGKTVLIDWAYPGPGAAGSELSQTAALLFQTWSPQIDDLALLRALHVGLTEDWQIDVPFEELLAGYELGFCLRPAHALGGPVLGAILSGRASMVGADDMGSRLAAAEATFQRIERGARRLGFSL